MRSVWVTGVAAAVLMAAGVSYYVAWQHGNDIRILGVGVVRRFPCSDYYVPHSGYVTTQAFAVIDAAALAARSNNRQAVRTLIDAVFDRELPGIRCGNLLRRRVTDAEWQVRIGTMPPLTEPKLADATNDILRASGAAPWARTSVEELHFLRALLRNELPTFVGTIDGGRQLSEKMSPIEAVFVLMTLGKGMVMDPDEFRDGPEAYLARARERQLNPPPSGAVLRARVMDRATLELANGQGFDDQRTLAATSAQRVLDELGVPR